MYLRSTHGLTAIFTAIALGWFAHTPQTWGGEFETITSLVYRQVGTTKLLADVYVPKGPGPFPGVLCIHGGAWVMGHRIEMIGIGQALARNGYTAVSIDYRLAPLDRFPAQIDDCRAALGWLRREAATYKVDPNRIGVWGYSAGGHLAALLGLDQQPSRPNLRAADDPTRIRAIVAGGAPCEFRKIDPDSSTYVFWLGGTRREKPDVYAAASPAAFVSPDDPPILFYHGEADLLVNVRQSRAMVQRCQAAGVPAEIHTIPGAGHIQTFLDSTTFKKGIAFLDRHLKPVSQ